MSIFGAIKNKILHKNEDLSDMRSHVLGEPSMDRLPPPPGIGVRPGEQDMNVPNDLPPEPMNSKDELGMPPELDDLGPTDLSRPLDDEEQLDGSGMRQSFVGPVKEPIEMNINNEKDAREIIHRLEFIENQLSAIKSQTETVNERLKNIEVKIDRRYR